MLFIGIDIASKKHDCYITGENGDVLAPIFTFENNRLGFEFLINTIRSHSKCKLFTDVKIGLESTGHYSNNLIEFLQSKQISMIIFNPL